MHLIGYTFNLTFAVYLKRPILINEFLLYVRDFDLSMWCFKCFETLNNFSEAIDCFEELKSSVTPITNINYCYNK